METCMEIQLIETMNPNWIDLAQDITTNIEYWKNKEI